MKKDSNVPPKWTMGYGAIRGIVIVAIVLVGVSVVYGIGKGIKNTDFSAIEMPPYITSFFTGDTKSVIKEEDTGLAKAIDAAVAKTTAEWNKRVAAEAKIEVERLALLKAEESAAEVARLANVAAQAAMKTPQTIKSIGASVPPAQADCVVVTLEDTAASRRAAGILGCSHSLASYMKPGKAKVCDPVTFECEPLNIH